MIPDLLTRANVVDLASYRAAHPRPERPGVRVAHRPTLPSARDIEHRQRMLQHLTEQGEQTRGDGLIETLATRPPSELAGTAIVRHG